MYRSAGAEERKEGVERDNVDLGAETEEERKYFWYQKQNDRVEKRTEDDDEDEDDGGEEHTLYDTHEDRIPFP